MASIGIGEGLLLVLISIVTYVIPIAVVIWIVVTLKQVRADQAWIRGKLESIEQLLRKGSAE